MKNDEDSVKNLPACGHVKVGVQGIVSASRFSSLGTCNLAGDDAVAIIQQLIDRRADGRR